MTEPTPNSDTTGIKGRWKKATEGVGQKIAIGWYAFGNIGRLLLKDRFNCCLYIYTDS